MYDVKNLSVRSNSTALITPRRNLKQLFQKIGGDRFQAKTHTSRHILDLGRYNFLPVATMVMILVFLESQCTELSKNVYCYPFLPIVSE